MVWMPERFMPEEYKSRNTLGVVLQIPRYTCNILSHLEYSCSLGELCAMVLEAYDLLTVEKILHDVCHSRHHKVFMLHFSSSLNIRYAFQDKGSS